MTNCISSHSSYQSEHGNRISSLHPRILLRKLARLKDYPKITLIFHLNEGIEVIERSEDLIQADRDFLNSPIDNKGIDLSLLPGFVYHIITNLKPSSNRTRTEKEEFNHQHKPSINIIKGLSEAIEGLKTLNATAQESSMYISHPRYIQVAIDQLNLLIRQWEQWDQSSYFLSFPFEKNETTDTPFQRINQIVEDKERLEKENKTLNKRMRWLKREVDFLSFDQKRFTQRIRELIEENERLKIQIHSKDRPQYFDYTEKIRSVHFSSKM